MGARPPLTFFKQLRDLRTVLSSDAEQFFTNREWERLIDATAEDIACYLPPATGSRHMFRPKKVDSSEHIAEIFAAEGDLIDDSASITLVGQWSDAWLIDAQPGRWDNTGPSFPNGIPQGGTTGQFLSKLSDDDYDVDWFNAPSGAFVQLSGEPTSFDDFIAKGAAAGWW